MPVERVGRAIGVSLHVCQAGCACIPERHAIATHVGEVKLGGGERSFLKEWRNDLEGPNNVKMLQKFHLLGKPQQSPTQAAHPGAERGIPLLGAGTTKRAVIDIENGFVRGSSTHIIAVAVSAEIDVIAGGYLGMFEETLEQANFL